jgi:Rrf2 family nitric oxide-sensitive transcriptional repressor
MLTQTTVTAVRILTHVGRAPGRVFPLRGVAAALEESPSYLAKVAHHLVRAGLLGALRGKSGGVVLERPAREITLLAVVEACQGTIPGAYCRDGGETRHVCALHCAGVELRGAILAVLQRWTLDDLLRDPLPAPKADGHRRCLLHGGRRRRPAGSALGNNP